MLGALALLLLQGPVLDVTVSVDRERVAVGDQVVFTLKAIGHSTAAFRVDLPALDGFAQMDRRERTDVVTTAREVTRAFTLELTLRAEQVGSWEIGPIRIEHGEASAFSPVAVVTVVNAASGGSTGLDADLLALIPRVPSPRPGGPSVYVVTSADQMYAGDQVNVLTAAWLPRGLRLRLRQPPTLTPPALPGVWSTPRSSVPGAVASRVLDGETYDLFVGFQTVYPLNAGPVTIPAARLSWVQPGTRASSGDDRRESVASGTTSILVRDPPAAGRPVNFDGPVARDMDIEYRLSQSSARAGSALQVDIVVNGAGNLPLWPAPRVAWSSEARVYEDGTEGAPHPIGLRLGGAKRFKYSVVPDSAGSLALPALEYQYFDPGDGSFRVARAPAILVPVLEPLPLAERRTPVPVEQPGPMAVSERVMRLPGIALAALVLLPLLVMGVVTGMRLRPLRAAPAPRLEDPASRLETLVRGLVGRGTGAAPSELITALRKAGVDRDRAERLVQLHGALEAERFGKSGAGQATPELTRSIESAFEGIPRRVLRMAGYAAAVALLLAPERLRAQDQDPVEQYEHTNYVAAARGFRTAASVPGASPVLLYNAAAAEYMSRQDAHAAAALLVVRSREPRDPRVQELWNALAREHDQLRRAERIWPVTAEECLAVGIALLWLGALLFVLLGRRSLLWAIPLAASVAAAVCGWSLIQERSVPRAVLTGNSSLRVSPHGLAPERGTVPAFTVVRLDRRFNGWRLVETRDGATGWVPADILAETPPLN